MLRFYLNLDNIELENKKKYILYLFESLYRLLDNEFEFFGYLDDLVCHMLVILSEQLKS